MKIKLNKGEVTEIVKAHILNRLSTNINPDDYKVSFYVDYSNWYGNNEPLDINVEVSINE